MRNPRLRLIAIAVIAVIIAGEVYIYSFNSEEKYSIGASISEGGLSYSVYSGISNQYDVVITDNGDFIPSSEYYIYYDETYASNLKEVIQPIGSTKLDQSYYYSQLVLQLENRGIATTTVNADELREKLDGDIASLGCEKGLIVLSGAPPDTVYSGKDTDTIMKWITAGGRLYWAGGAIGSCYSTKDKVIPVETDYQQLFFGVSDCLNMNGNEKAYEDDNSNQYRNALSLSSNALRYAPDTASIPDSITLGYTDGKYSSISLVRHGSGMICIVAGDYSNDQRSDLAQMVSSNICYQSEMIDHKSGTVTRGSVSGICDIHASGHVSVYIYLGGYYLVNAKNSNFFNNLVI